MGLKLSLLLQAIDKASRPTRKAAGSYTFMEKAIAKAAGTSVKLARSQEHLERRLRRNKRLAKGRMFQAIEQSASRASQKIRKFTRDLKVSERGMKLAKRAAGGLFSKLTSMAKYGLFAAGAGATWSLFNMFKNASDMEQFKIMLEGTEGSAFKAGKAMKWVRKFAETTPYELDQVMSAFVQLRAYGIDPTDGSLRSLGDGAAGMRKDLMQAVEALADAQTGEFERLKEFAIKSKSEGNSVTFSYIKNGKILTRTVKKDANEIREALTGIFDDRFGGGMKRQSKTFKGLTNNLKDQWLKFQLMVADAGIFDRVKNGAGDLLAKVEKLASNGSLERWAKNISEWLEKAWDNGVKFVEDTDWGSVASGLETIASVLLKIIGLIGKATSAWQNMFRERDQRLLENLEGGWLVSNEKKNRARAAFNKKYGPRKSNSKGIFGTTRPGKFKYAPSGKTRPLTSRQPANVNVSGKTEIDIRVKGDASAKVKRTASKGSDVPMVVTLGKSNSVPA
jgi:phage tail tape-measure protein